MEAETDPKFRNIRKKRHARKEPPENKKKEIGSTLGRVLGRLGVRGLAYSSKYWLT